MRRCPIFLAAATRRDDESLGGFLFTFEDVDHFVAYNFVEAAVVFGMATSAAKQNAQFDGVPNEKQGEDGRENTNDKTGILEGNGVHCFARIHA